MQSLFTIKTANISFTTGFYLSTFLNFHFNAIVSIETGSMFTPIRNDNSDKKHGRRITGYVYRWGKNKLNILNSAKNC